MASRKKLSLVGSENNECSLQSADFADTLEEWHALEARLQSLYKKNDDLLGDSPEDQTIAADLRKIQSDVEQELRELLHVIALKPAKKCSRYHRQAGNMEEHDHSGWMRSGARTTGRSDCKFRAFRSHRRASRQIINSAMIAAVRMPKRVGVLEQWVICLSNVAAWSLPKTA